MKAAQFFKGKIDGYEQSFETSNLVEFMDIDKISLLTEYANTFRPYHRYFKVDRVIARVEAYKIENGDVSGRGGIQTRGVLYKFDRDIEHEGFKYIFPEEQFIKDLTDRKLKLKMPPTPSLKKPLELPPPLEWET